MDPFRASISNAHPIEQPAYYKVSPGLWITSLTSPQLGCI